MLKDMVITKVLHLQKLNSNAWDGMIIMHGQQVWISKIDNDHLKATKIWSKCLQNTNLEHYHYTSSYKTEWNKGMTERSHKNYIIQTENIR